MSAFVPKLGRGMQMTRMALFFLTAYFNIIHPFDWAPDSGEAGTLSEVYLNKVDPAPPPGPGFSPTKPGTL